MAHEIQCTLITELSRSIAFSLSRSLSLFFSFIEKFLYRFLGNAHFFNIVFHTILSLFFRFRIVHYLSLNAECCYIVKRNACGDKIKIMKWIFRKRSGCCLWVCWTISIPCIRTEWRWCFKIHEVISRLWNVPIWIEWNTCHSKASQRTRERICVCVVRPNFSYENECLIFWWIKIKKWKHRNSFYEIIFQSNRIWIQITDAISMFCYFELFGWLTRK